MGKSMLWEQARTHHGLVTPRLARRTDRLRDDDTRAYHALIGNVRYSGDAQGKRIIKSMDAP
jgi:hypothetical protein